MSDRAGFLMWVVISVACYAAAAVVLVVTP